MSRHRRGIKALMVAMSAVALVLVLAVPASAVAPKIPASCATSMNGERYYAESSFTHVGSISGSAYYLSYFKTGGGQIDQVDIVLHQAAIHEETGIPYPIYGAYAKRGLNGNTAFFVGPEWTGNSIVWITPNESLDGNTDEKVAILEARFHVGGAQVGKCQMMARQP